LPDQARVTPKIEDQNMSNPSVYFIKIDSGNTGQRVDNFLMSKLKGVPKSRIYRILRKGEVRVNKKRVKPDYRLCLGDEVRIPPVRTSDDPVKLTPNKRALALLDDSILYEDKGMMVLNKPSGLAVHAGSGVDYGLIDILREKFPNQHFALVHRLDRATSGCLMIAKDRETLLALHKALRDGECVKVYTLLTKGVWSKRHTTVDAPLDKTTQKHGERHVTTSDEGKDSVTHFDVIKKFTDATLLNAKIDTGRTHQIRVHAEHLGFPIAGDEKYGNIAFNKGMRHYGLRRLFLHASKITFPNPETGEMVTVEAPLGEDLQLVIKELP